MKIKNSVLLSAVMALSGASFQAGATCPAGASCGSDADGMLCNGSIPVGVVVHKDVRDGLQSGIFPMNSICNPGNPNYSVYADSRSCMPGISTAELNGLFWQAASWYFVNPPPVTSNLRHCGLSMDTYFGTAAMSYVTNGGNLPYLISSPGAQDSISAVEQCMIYYGLGKSPDSHTIGFLPADTIPTEYYRFIKLDGVAPTLSEHLSGNYNLVANVANASSFPKTVQSFGVVGGGFVQDGAPTKSIQGVCFSKASLQQTTYIVPDT